MRDDSDDLCVSGGRMKGTVDGGWGEGDEENAKTRGVRDH